MCTSMDEIERNEVYQRITNGVKFMPDDLKGRLYNYQFDFQETKKNF